MFLADTNLLFEPRQARPDPHVLAWLSAHESELFISAITIAEIQSGISLLDDGRKKRALQQWLDDLRLNFRAAVLAFDDSVAIRWGQMNAELIRQGRRIPIGDSLLAATALHHHLTVATRNEKDFIAAGVKTINPWTAS
jgi:predicted nucleic acid-binding protein